MNIIKLYKESFLGFRKEVWWLAFVTLINRAGTMVIPFLSLYLKKDLQFSTGDIGWVMSCFGAGSIVGAWIGGKLTDKIGFYPVMFWSLIISGILFVFIQYLESFWSFCAGIFLVMMVADTFRPAAFVAINVYSKPENRTRAVSLLRLAINFGFSMGPAAGGLIIYHLSYKGLFWVDGITCILAGILFIITLNNKESNDTKKANAEKTNVQSPYKDKAYLLFLFILLLIGFSFLQYFSTIPLYYAEKHQLIEKHIGWLMTFNGLLIVIFEMPLVKEFEKPKYNIFNIIAISTLMFALSFFVLNITEWVGILLVGMALMSFAEIFNFPFLNSFAMTRGEKHNLGEYMALFTIAFSISHLFSHNAGMHLIEKFGYEITWNIMTGCLIVAALLILVLKKMVNNEQKGS